MMPDSHPIRLLFLIRDLGRGGAERQLITLATALPAGRFDVTLATLYSGGALEADLAGSPVKLRSLQKAGRWDLVAFGRRLAALIASERPDIVHGYLPTCNLIATAARRAAPGARLVWGVRASGMDWSRYDWLARVEFEATRLLAGQADLIIANSEEGARWHLEQGYPASRTEVIPNGIDVARFRPDPGARARLRAEHAIREDQRLIGLVGRLDPVKDHPTFLLAAARLAGTVPNARFICVGDGPASYSRELQQRGEQLGLAPLLTWLPASANMRETYSALDILTSASRFEGFPNVVAEAMACGVPCAVTDSGDAARIVGRLGEVARPADAQDLAGAVLRLLPRLSPELSALCAERIALEYSVSRLVSRTTAALEGLA